MEVDLDPLGVLDLVWLWGGFGGRRLWDRLRSGRRGHLIILL